MKTYGTYTTREVIDEDFLGVKLNGIYDLSFFLDFPGYPSDKITKVIDGEIAIPGHLNNSTSKFVSIEHTMTQEEQDAYIAEHIPTEFNLNLFTDTNEALVWLRNNTSMIEESTGKFITYEGDQLTPAQYLIVD